MPSVNGANTPSAQPERSSRNLLLPVESRKMRKLEITRSFWGTYRVRYDCPGCGERLRSPLDDVGKNDTCPDCRKGFIVPGAEERATLVCSVQAGRGEMQPSKIRKSKESGGAVFISLILGLFTFFALCIRVMIMEHAESTLRRDSLSIETTPRDSTVGTDSFEYRFVKERFKVEGFSEREASEAAKAVIKFHNSQQNR